MMDGAYRMCICVAYRTCRLAYRTCRCVAYRTCRCGVGPIGCADVGPIGCADVGAGIHTGFSAKGGRHGAGWGGQQL